MAYTAVPTITTGDVATAAWGNTYIKDNFAAGVPDIFTADGEVAIGTGANTAESVAILDSSNVLKRAYGGLEVALSDPNADRILFWDDGAGDYAYLTPGTNLEIDGTTMNASGAVAATQAEMEAASSTTVFVVPGRNQYHPGVSKARGNISDAGVLAAGSYNITSSAKDATGVYTITWATDFSDTTYSCASILNTGSSAQRRAVIDTINTGTITVNCWSGTTPTDLLFQVLAAGDQ